MSYIVPRDKPKECYKCPFMDRITYDCKLMYSNDYPDFESQYKDCPLVEISFGEEQMEAVNEQLIVSFMNGIMTDVRDGCVL